MAGTCSPAVSPNRGFPESEVPQSCLWLCERQMLQDHQNPTAAELLRPQFGTADQLLRMELAPRSPARSGRRRPSRAPRLLQHNHRYHHSSEDSPHSSPNAGRTAAPAFRDRSPGAPRAPWPRSLPSRIHSRLGLWPAAWSGWPTCCTLREDPTQTGEETSASSGLLGSFGWRSQPSPSSDSAPPASGLTEVPRPQSTGGLVGS
mmetsp:Transcript_41015/g.57112  ORF Transcript_41015/g.57112 Transcript_41015/m.57112 type:complete len:204 (+) Transcript_41015:580-1191(+)